MYRQLLSVCCFCTTVVSFECLLCSHSHWNNTSCSCFCWRWLPHLSMLSAAATCELSVSFYITNRDIKIELLENPTDLSSFTVSPQLVTMGPRSRSAPSLFLQLTLFFSLSAVCPAAAGHTSWRWTSAHLPHLWFLLLGSGWGEGVNAYY